MNIKRLLIAIALTTILLLSQITQPPIILSSLTTSAIVTGNGSTGIQTPSATSTLDSSGNAVFAGSMTATTKVLVANGTVAAPTHTFTNFTGQGLYAATGVLGFSLSGGSAGNFTSTGLAAQGFGIVNSTNAQVGGLAMTTGSISWGPNATMDSNISRTGVGILAVGNGTGQNTSGNIQAASFIAGGAAPSISGCTTISAQHGGNTIGDFTTSTTGACTATLTFAYTAGTGWFCDAQDLTSFASFANIFHQTGGTTTTAVIAATTVAGDVVKFACFPY